MKQIIIYSILIIVCIIAFNGFITKTDFAVVKQNQGIMENRIEAIKKSLNF